MTRHGSIPVAKGLGAGQGLPHRDWAGVLPTQKLPATNLATPKSFIAIDPTVQKLINNLNYHRITLTTRPQGTSKGASNEKTKNKHLLKFNFKRGIFITNCQIIEKKLLPPWGSPTWPRYPAPATKSKICSATVVWLDNSVPKWYDTTR